MCIHVCNIEDFTCIFQNILFCVFDDAKMMFLLCVPGGMCTGPWRLSAFVAETEAAQQSCSPDSCLREMRTPF